MDLDKLKQIAKEKGSFALKKIIGTIESSSDVDVPDEQDNIEKTEEQPSVSENTTAGETQRFNLHEVINKLRTIPESDKDDCYSYDEVDTDKTSVDNTSIKNDDSFNPSHDDDHDCSNGEVISDDLIENIRTSLEDMRNTLSASIGNDISKIPELLDKLDNKAEKLNDVYEQTQRLLNLIDRQISESSKNAINVNGKLNSLDSRLSEISNSLGSISKLNDSIFDLKNSQVNSKNSINELEASFLKLKKKTTIGIVIISIISFVVVILEIVNLLS